MPGFKMKKDRGYKAIKAAMAANERRLLARIGASNAQGIPFWFHGVPSVSTLNALDRLLDKRKIKRHRTRFGTGYIVVR